MKLIIPVIFALAIAASVAYLFLSYDVREKPSSGCREIGASEMNSLIGSFMADEGHANYAVGNVSPIYCSFGVSTYNVNSEVTVKFGEPTRSTGRAGSVTSRPTS